MVSVSLGSTAVLKARGGPKRAAGPTVVVSPRARLTAVPIAAAGPTGLPRAVRGMVRMMKPLVWPSWARWGSFSPRTTLSTSTEPGCYRISIHCSSDFGWRG